MHTGPERIKKMSVYDLIEEEQDSVAAGSNCSTVGDAVAVIYDNYVDVADSINMVRMFTVKMRAIGGQVPSEDKDTLTKIYNNAVAAARSAARTAAAARIALAKCGETEG